MNALGLVTLPLGVVSTTSLTPAVPIGVNAVTEVALTTTTLVAAVPPIVTLLVPVKFVPEIVMVVAPLVGPDAGVTVPIVGSAI